MISTKHYFSLFFAAWLSQVCAFSNIHHIQLPGAMLSVQQQQRVPTMSSTALQGSKPNNNINERNADDKNKNIGNTNIPASSCRRNLVSNLGTIMVMMGAAAGVPLAMTPLPVSAAQEEESSSFASIAARANQISKELDTSPSTSDIQKTDKTMYDFELPIEGNNVPFKDIVRQQFQGDNAKVKAVLVVNIKQDDPVARKDIPELISLVTK